MPHQIKTENQHRMQHAVWRRGFICQIHLILSNAHTDTTFCFFCPDARCCVIIVSASLCSTLAQVLHTQRAKSVGPPNLPKESDNRVIFLITNTVGNT